MVDCKIVTDSSSDLYALSQAPFAVAPLKIITTQKEYIDDCHTDVAAMVEDLAVYKGRSSTSCPNAEDWVKAFGDEKYVICVTITGTLSGCYNAACAAKAMVEEQDPERRVFVLNSLTTGPEMRLIIETICELRQTEESFESLCEAITRYTQKTGLFFILESMRNLANNGRVSPFTAKAAGLLGIRVVGTASEKGDLQTLDKCRGEQKALSSVVRHMKERGEVKKVRIAHAVNEEAALALKQLVAETFPLADILVYPCGALCSFYAEKGGLLIGIETK